MAKVGPRTERLLLTVEPEFADVVRHAMLAAPDWLDFAVVSGKRTTEEQQELFAQGRDENGEIVDQSLVTTYRDGVEVLSNHQDHDGNGYGEAIDIVAFVNGRPDFREMFVMRVAAYVVGYAKARGLDLTGGVKWMWDVGHLELDR